jgi:glutamate synthase domain-containing protein 3
MSVMLTENLLRTGNTHSWDERTTALTASDAGTTDYFGFSCALSGDGTVLAVGAQGWDGGAGSNQGAVYVFDWNGSSWTERTTALTASDAGASDFFGSGCALSSDGTVLAVGAYGWDGGAGSDQGAVYIFDWNGSSWTERTTALTPSDAGGTDRFGRSCALSSDGTVLAVGSFYWDGGGGDQGAVYIYDWNGSSWDERTTALTASDAGATDYFGISCALSSDGTVLAVGPYYWDGGAGTDQGAIYIFDWNGSSWDERTTALTASDAGSSDYFGSGCSLSSDGTVLAVGAQGWDGGGGSEQGAVYVYDWIGSTSGSNIGITDGRTSTTESFESGIVREIIVDNGSATDINCIAAARHNLSTMGATLAVEGSSNGVSFSALFSVTPTDDNILLSLQSTQSYRYYKIKISGHTGTVTIADLAIGKYITLERDQKYGFIAPEFADGDQVLPNVTRGQNLVGLSIKEGFKKIRLQLPYYTSSFYDTNWANIIAALKSYPIYLNWKLANDAVPFYCWPSRALPQAKYSANISGYAYLDSTMDLEGITS